MFKPERPMHQAGPTLACRSEKAVEHAGPKLAFKSEKPEPRASPTLFCKSEKAAAHVGPTLAFKSEKSPACAGPALAFKPDKPAACECPKPVCPMVAAPMQNMPDTTTAAEAATTPAPFGPPLQRHLRLHLAPYFNFSQLAAQDDNTGAALSLTSRYNVGVTAGLSTNLLEHLELALDLRGGMLDYASPTRNSALLTSALFSYEVTLSAELTVLKRLGLVFGISYGNEPFSASDSTQVQEVVMTDLPSAMGALRLTALRLKRWLLGVEFLGAYKLGAAETDYTVHSGTWLYAGAFWQLLRADGTAWTVSAGYGQRQQNTTLITQTDKDIALEVSYRWSLENK